MAATERTPAQHDRQTRRERDGRYEVGQRCYKCNRNAGYEYWSSRYTDADCPEHGGDCPATGGRSFGDAGLVLCAACAELADAASFDVAYLWLTQITADRPVVDCGLANGCYHKGCQHKGKARAAAQREQRAAAAQVKAEARQAVRDEKEAKRLANLAAWVRCGCTASRCVGWAWREAHAFMGKSDPYAPEDTCGLRANKKTGRCSGCGDWCQ